MEKQIYRRKKAQAQLDNGIFITIFSQKNENLRSPPMKSNLF